MEMSVVDDDDGFWANEDFIATIENVVKKAEVASAAKHGGTQTQFGALPPHSSSASVPPMKNNFRIGEGGPSALDTVSCYREDGVGDFRWIASIGAPQRQPLRRQVSLQSLNHQGQVAVLDSHQSLQEASIFGQPNRGADCVGQLMAEKDGMISFLRSRVQEAEQQVDELRLRVGPQNVSHPILHEQQDHEIVEGQRARAENEERLRDALAETIALKEELEKLKQSRRNGAELKRPRNQTDLDCFEHQWLPPWVPNKTSEAEGNTGTGLRNNFLKNACEVEDPLTSVEVPIETHKMDGSVSFDGEESTRGDKLRTNENHDRNMSRRTGARRTVAGTSRRGDGEKALSTDHLNIFSRTIEMHCSLQCLWEIKGVGNDGVSLLSKLYASCRQDLSILFSNIEYQVVKSPGSTESGKAGEIKGGKISEKLHTALAKVTNRLAHPDIMITPLLEFCNLESAHLVGSALHVLRCILQHDSTCRQSLLLRGWYIRGVLNKGGNLQPNFRDFFSSPRILLRTQVGDNSVQHMHGGQSFTEGNGARSGGPEFNPKPSASDQHLQRPLSEHEEAGVNDTDVPTEGLNLLVKWMLQLALTSSSPHVKLEAIANILVLVNSSEPLSERAMFGPLLCHGAIDVLLKDSRAEIQLQAVKITHLLLHCPTIIQRFCVADEGDKNMMDQSKSMYDSNPRRPRHLGNQTGKLSVDGHSHPGISAQTVEKSTMGVWVAPKQAPYTKLSKLKLLEGLSECLKQNGNSPQGYALHKSVIGLVSFILAFGESGAAALIQTRASCEDPQSGKTSKNDGKAEGPSGQHIVGDGSGVTCLKDGQDFPDKGNGIPEALAEESVDDSERAQNIPQRLLTLIASQLDIEEREEWNQPSFAEERDHLIYEAVTVLCCLASDEVQSAAVIGHLTSNKDIARLTLSVTNRLVSRRSHSKESLPSNSDISELARTLRESVVSVLEGTSPLFFYQ